MNIRIRALLVLSALSCCISNVTFAQSTTGTPLGVCSSVAADPDGDGFGFEFNPDISAFDSCVVTSESEPRPIRINRETGEEINFIRPFWNAERDIANRDIECVEFRFNEESQTYESNMDTNADLPFGTNRYRHEPLPNVAPFVGRALFERTRVDPVGLAEVWTLNNGLYRGPMFVSSNWVEVVTDPVQDNTVTRFWFYFSSPDNNSRYDECRDTSGQPFAPTGTFDEVLPTPTAPVPFELTATGFANPAEEVIVNLETGLEVVLQPAVWDIFNDLIGREIVCTDSVYRESANSYQILGFPVIFQFYNLVDERDGVFGGFVTRNQVTLVVSNSRWGVVDGRIFLNDERNFNTDFNQFFAAEVVERVVNSSDPTLSGVRSWSSSEQFTECFSFARIVGVGLTTTDPRDLSPAFQVLTTESDNEGGSVNEPDSDNVSNTEVDNDSDSSTESDTDNDSGTDANTDSDSDTDTNTDNSDDTSNVTDSGSGSGGGSMGLTTLLVGLSLLRLRRRRTTPESFY